MPDPEPLKPKFLGAFCVLREPSGMVSIRIASQPAMDVFLSVLERGMSTYHPATDAPVPIRRLIAALYPDPEE